MNTKINLVVFALLLLIADVSADVLINEVYPNPIASEYDGEFIELYNTRNESIDLSNWTIENPTKVKVLIPDGTVMQANSHLLIADGGFELGKDNVDWPNADIEQEMILKNTGETLMLKNGSYVVDMVGWGNSTAEGTPLKTPQAGMSLERVNFSDTQNNSYDFKTSAPTPTNSTTFSGDNLNVVFSIKDTKPVFEKVEVLKDDSGADGVQILSSIEGDTIVPISVLMSDLNGVNEISSVWVVFNNKGFNLTLENTTEVYSSYHGNFSIPTNFLFGTYNVVVFGLDNKGYKVNTTVSIEVLPILAVRLNNALLNFGEINPGTYSNEAAVTVENIGNSPISIGLSGTDLKSNSGYLAVENVLYKSNSAWFNLSKNESFMQEKLVASAKQNVLFKLFAPVGYSSDTYRGKIVLTTMAA